MEFRIADTFTDSLARLTGEEQKAVKTTAFDLQLTPAQPGMQLHKLDQARDPRFWSVRVSRDVPRRQVNGTRIAPIPRSRSAAVIGLGCAVHLS